MSENFFKGNFFTPTTDKEINKKYFEKNPLFKSAGIFKDWPLDRLIYLNLQNELMIFINEEDHLQIKLNTKDKEKISNNLVTYFDLLHKLEEEFAFAYDNEIGYLNTLPINSGSATFFSCKIKIPKNEFNKGDVLLEIIKKIEDGGKDLNLSIDKNVNENVNENYYILSISNKSPYYSFIDFLIDILKIKEHLR